MKKGKKAGVGIICMLIAVLLAGCQTQPPMVAPSSSPDVAASIAPVSADAGRQPIAKGRYVESLIDLRGYDDINAITAQGDTLYVAAMKEGQDGTKFFQVKGDQTEELGYVLDPIYTVSSMTADKDGRITVICYDLDSESKGRDGNASISSSDGAVSKRYARTAYQFALDGDTFVKQFELGNEGRTPYALDDGRYLVYTYGGVFVSDDSGSRERDLSIQNASSIALSGDVLYACSSDNDFRTKITRHQWPSGEKADEIELPVEIGMNVLITGDGAGGVYLVSENGVYYLGASGNKLEMLMEGPSFLFGDPDSFVLDACATPSGSLYLLLRGHRLARYAWSEDAPIYEQTELTIASVSESYLIKRAIAAYMRAHPDVKITYRTYVPINYALNITFTEMDELDNTRTQMEDAVRAINTEVLSGNAPDILLLDNMPFASYIQKGVLDDMSAWAGERLKSGAWMANIAGSFTQTDGSLPCVPVTFNIPVLWGDSAQIEPINTLNDLVRAAQSPRGEHLLDINSERSLLTTLYPVFAAEHMGEDGKVMFTTDELAAFLTQIKAIQDALAPADSEEGSSRTFDNLAAGKTDLMLTELGMRGLGESIYPLLKFAGKQPDLRLLPTQTDKGMFTPSNIVSVSAGSSHKNVAYDFLDLLLSDEFVSKEFLPFNNGPISIVSAITEEKIRSASSKLNYALANVDGRDVPTVEMDDAMCEKIISVVGEANQPMLDDYSLMVMMLQEFMPYLRGEAPLESVVESLHGHIKAYLAE